MCKMSKQISGGMNLLGKESLSKFFMLTMRKNNFSEEAVRQSGNPTSKTSIEMENHVFMKARTKEDYLGLVARLIIHVREMKSKSERIAGGQMGGMPPGSQGMAIQSAPGVPDPINALQNLARQGTTASGGIPGGPQMQMAGGNPQSHPGSVMGQQGMIQGHHPNMNSGMNSISGGQLLSSFPPNSGIVSSIQQLAGQQPQLLNMVNQPNSAIPEAIPSSMQLQYQKIRAQQQNLRPATQMTPIQQASGIQQVVPDNVLAQQGQQMSPANIPRQSTPNSFMGNSPVSLPVANQGPGSNQPMSMSPATQHLQPSLASPSGQMLSSPVSNVGGMPTRTPGGVMGPISSPGSALNTPGGPSPAGRYSETQMYMDKLKSLQKYVEPLRRMINKFDKGEEGNKKDSSRMRNLLDILCNPNKRLPMETLLKCETVLERMDLRPTDAVAAGTTNVALSPAQVTALPGSKPQDQNMCQLLLDAVMNHIKYPTFNHTLQRTFGPAITAVHGPQLRFPTIPATQKKYEEEKFHEIPDLVQGEIARLDQRFKVSLDPIQHTGSKIIHLVCQLDDSNLPCVPPISVSIPENYPEVAPKFDINEEEYSMFN
ncbi:Mediator of RNA polymerase II transcription subunit 15 [Nymphon striatum]|nr:Mediator of RNA polymerase II transcription subunit 15 [Nymphon striatum]